MADALDYAVNLTTAGAKSAIDRLRKKKQATKRRVSFASLRGLPSKVGLGVGALGGYAAVNRVINKHAKTDPWESAMAPVMASVQRFVDESVGYSVKGRQRALSDTNQRLAMQTYLTGSTEAAKSFYDTRNGITQLQESGRNIVRETLKGPELDDLLMRAADGYLMLLDKSFGYIYDGLTK